MILKNQYRNYIGNKINELDRGHQQQSKWKLGYYFDKYIVNSVIVKKNNLKGESKMGKRIN